MRLKIISQPYKVKCPNPDCKHDILIIVNGGEIRGQEKCPNCKTQFEWDLSEEYTKEMRSR